jgi:chaperonin GroES
MTPLHDRVLIKPDEPEEKTKGGVIMPDNAKERPVFGTIVAVGGGKFEGGHYVPMNLAEGDRVLYGKYSGIEVKIPETIDGKTADVEHVLMRESEIDAKV